MDPNKSVSSAMTTMKSVEEAVIKVILIQSCWGWPVNVLNRLGNK